MSNDMVDKINYKAKLLNLQVYKSRLHTKDK